MLQTDRCWIRPIDEYHFTGVHQLYVNEKGRQYLGGTRTHDEIKKLFFEMMTAQADLYWGVHEKTLDRFIGLVSITPHHDNDDLELSYQFSPDVWGCGYATEVIRKVIDYAFETLKVTKLVAETQVANIASCKLLERVGMKRTTTTTRFGAEQAIYSIIAS